MFPIAVPPLREREGDIPVLIGHILDTIRTQFQLKTLHIHPLALQKLEQQQWLGNVRELEHTLMRAGLRAMQEQAKLIEWQHFNADLSIGSTPTAMPEESERGVLALLPTEPTPMRTAVEAYQNN